MCTEIITRLFCKGIDALIGIMYNVCIIVRNTIEGGIVKKALKTIAIMVSALIVVCMTGTMLLACTPREIKADKAIQ